MRIKSVEITNFRCIENLIVEFDEVTTFVGPNGAGKSTILRALDWFFNGGTLTESDVYSGARTDDPRIQVSVRFTDLTPVDRDALGPKYCPPGIDTFVAWRTWMDGTDKFTGKAKAYPPFEEVRAASGAAERKALLNAASTSRPDLSIPRWTNQTASLIAMDEWEREHPDLLTEAEVSDTHFFGFRGDKKLSGIFDYVLVAADLRATEESSDNRTAIVGRLLDLVVDKTEANRATEQLISELGDRQTQINAEHLDEQLATTAKTISEEMDLFAAGRTVRLAADSPVPKIQNPRISITVLDGQVETSVERQGHGLQRTLLISTLRLLASKGAANPASSTVVLAVEEPELFQHPTQAKLLASVLRQISSGPDSGVQVAYATHSPYFIDPNFFDQVRRITRRERAGTPAPSVEVNQASMSTVSARLEGHTAHSALVSRWQQVCLNNLSEAFFANAVVLVEGDHDKAVLDGIAKRTRSFEVDGIVVATANGKLKIQVPHSILTELGIPVLCIFDSDSGQGDRMRRDGKDPEIIEQQERSMKRENRAMLRYFGLDEVDYPEGLVSALVGVTPDNIETELESNWQAWHETRTALIDGGRGAGGKNAATYSLAASECETEPEGLLIEFVEAARKLVAPSFD